MKNDNDYGVFLKLGHYYRWLYSVNDVFKADLCRLCNGKKVINYHKCLFAGKGEIRLLGLTGCLDQGKYVVEITEEEYQQAKLAKLLEEL